MARQHALGDDGQLVVVLHGATGRLVTRGLLVERDETSVTVKVRSQLVTIEAPRKITEVAA